MMQEEDQPLSGTKSTSENSTDKIADAFGTSMSLTTTTPPPLPPSPQKPVTTTASADINIGKPALSDASAGQFYVNSSISMPPAHVPSLVPAATPPSVVPTGSASKLEPLPPFALAATGAPPAQTEQPPNPFMAGMASGPPKSGFQPLQQAPPTTMVPSTQTAPSTEQASVNIFTPAFDPNAPTSPYAAAVPLPQQYQTPQHYQQPSSYTSPPGVMQSPHDTSIGISIDAGMPSTGYQHQPLQRHNSEDPSLFEWIKNHETVNMVMQKAKKGVETMITTMDPQMRDVLYSGGDINIVVASSKAVKVEPVKEAFQGVFGRATVTGQASQPSIAPQPVGYVSGLRGAEERIQALRSSGLIHGNQVVVSVESFIVDLQPEQWFDISCLVLSDPYNNVQLQTYSQATPVSTEYVKQAQSETPQDYNLSWSGLAVTVGQIMSRSCHLDPSDWQYNFSGVSRRETILMAARQLAFMYKQRMPQQQQQQQHQ